MTTTTEQLVDEILQLLQESEIAGLLPDALKNIAEILSQREALLIAAAYGGTRRNLGTVQGPAQDVIDLLGTESATRLAREYGGEYLELPTLSRFTRSVRDRKLVHLREQGHSIRSLARHFEMTSRRIYVILSRERAKKEKARDRNALKTHSRDTQTDQRSEP